ncbi:MAG: CusA/CzcA family heavy metal efflux RND transporter [Muribaculaceae bacterium]|nr:CusA/CzcA family heavy metal efflux RND transporter [Muribaculaceae bacterium]
MLNKIINWSLTNRLIVLLAVCATIIAGLFVLVRTEIDIFPDLNAPTVAIMTEAAGLAPEEVEKSVTYPIETAVNGASGVRRVRSSSATGFSVVWVEFDWNTDAYKARQTVSERLSGIEGSLPANVGNPVMGPQSSILGEIMIIGLTSDSISQGELRSVADRTIRPRLLSLAGVSQVSVIGGEELEYQILLSPEKMRHYGVSLSDVVDATENMNVNVSGGVTYEYGNEYLIKGVVATTDASEIADAAVKNESGQSFKIGDIAEVKVGPKTPKIGTATLRTKPAVLVTVTKQPAVGSIELTKEINKELENLSNSLPSGIEVDTQIFNQSQFIQTSVSNLQQSLLEGALFVIIVLFFFLMNLRTTVISVVAIPLSILITVIALYYMGFTINTMTLGGIAIAIGSLVDDAIVDVENVYKRLRENRMKSGDERLPIIKVVYEASREVRKPILNSTLIIVASFIPLFFLSGIEGRLLKPLGIAFIVALAASTVVALTLTPVLCSYLLAGDKKKEAKELDKEPKTALWLREHYSNLLDKVLLRPRPWLIGVSALFVIAVAVFFTLGRSFLPGFNEGSFTINVSAMPGISLEQSDSMGIAAERIIMSVPEVRNVARKTGRAELDEHALGVNTSEMEVPYILDKGRKKNEVVRELREKLSELPGVNVEIGQPISHRIDAMLSGAQAQIAVKIFGYDLDKLYTIGQQIGSEMKEVSGVVDVNVEQQISRPQLDIVPRREMLSKYGITIPEFARYVQMAIGGDVVSQVFVGNRPYDLTVKVEDTKRDTKERIEDLMIDSNVGMIPLSYVADVKVGSGPNTINRENVSRLLTVSANVDGRDLKSAVDEIKKTIAEHVELPEGYFVTYGGQFENEEAASRMLSLTSILALVVIFFLIYSEFKSVAESLTILVNMPLALIGGVLILRFTTGDLNIPAIIGFISLMGISTRNGMLLISRYNRLRSEGMGIMETVKKGSADRLLPIIMTALTSALALVPIAVRGGEPGNEIQSPLAIVILGGLISSTLLNIFIVPVLYKWIHQRKEKKSTVA